MHKYIITIAVSLASLLLIQNTHACSCGWGGPFLDMARHSDVIVQGRVLSYDRRKLSMKVRITRRYSGGIKRRTIRVWGDNGMLCRPYVTTFPVGTEWIFALNGSGSKPRYRAGTKYAISVCGAYWLQVKEGKVIGHIDKGRGHRDGKQQIPKAVFDRWMRKLKSN